MYRKNVSGQFLYFALVNATTGAGLTGASVSGARGIDGGTQAAVTGSISEDTGGAAVGMYHLALSQADTNGNNIGFIFTATNAVPVGISIVTTAANPTDGVRFGLTALPNAAAEAAGGLYTRGTGTGQVNQDANGRADANVAAWSGSAPGALPTNFSSLSIDGSGRVTLVPSQLQIKKNVQLTAFEFPMYNSSGSLTTGLTVTPTRSIDGAAFGACANAASEVGSGIYKITLAATDLNGNVITLAFAASGVPSTVVTIVTQP